MDMRVVFINGFCFMEFSFREIWNLLTVYFQARSPGVSPAPAFPASFSGLLSHLSKLFLLF